MHASIFSPKGLTWGKLDGDLDVLESNADWGRISKGWNWLKSVGSESDWGGVSRLLGWTWNKFDEDWDSG